jgi:hypothetical protein
VAVTLAFSTTECEGSLAGLCLNHTKLIACHTITWPLVCMT